MSALEIRCLLQHIGHGPPGARNLISGFLAPDSLTRFSLFVFFSRSPLQDKGAASVGAGAAPPAGNTLRQYVQHMSARACSCCVPVSTPIALCSIVFCAGCLFTVYDLRNSRRKTASGEAPKGNSNPQASVPQSAGTGASGMLRFYTEDAPGLIMYVPSADPWQLCMHY